MNTNVISFPVIATLRADNDDRPAGPAGNVVSISEFRRRTLVVRTKSGVFFQNAGAALAA
jgi:hypothetical protein